MKLALIMLLSIFQPTLLIHINPKISLEQYNISIKSNFSYEEVKTGIINYQSFFGKFYSSMHSSKKQKIIELSSMLLEEHLVNQVFPHWYGTPWDFNGHTNIPNNGVVACGYFVSTTLKHIGFDLNRFKLAQQNSLNIPKSLGPEYLITINRSNTEKMKKVLNEKFDDGLYVVGLDSHVGFLLIRMEEAFFIHSNYIDPPVVVIEQVDASLAFQSSTRYRIVPITGNKTLIENWILKNPVDIITSN